MRQVKKREDDDGVQQEKVETTSVAATSIMQIRERGEREKVMIIAITKLRNDLLTLIVTLLS